MKIHILDILEKDKPKDGDEVKANCGEKVAFHPIDPDWSDPRVCEKCLILHKATPSICFSTYSMRAFAIPEKQENSVGESV